MDAIEVVRDSHPVYINQKTVNWERDSRLWQEFHSFPYLLLLAPGRDWVTMPGKAKGRPKVPKNYQLYPQRECLLHCSPQSGTPGGKVGNRGREWAKNRPQSPELPTASSLAQLRSWKWEGANTQGTASLVYILERGLKIRFFKSQNVLKHSIRFSLQKAQWEQVLDKIKLPISLQLNCMEKQAHKSTPIHTCARHVHNYKMFLKCLKDNLQPWQVWLSE